MHTRTKICLSLLSLLSLFSLFQSHLAALIRLTPMRTASLTVATISLLSGVRWIVPCFAATFISSSSGSVTRKVRSSMTNLSISDRVRQTLDPCIILMKQLISKHADKWEDQGGIYSLAQGIVYWKPPHAALDAVCAAATAGPEADIAAIHTYCPDEGLPELRASLRKKLQEENGLIDTDVIVTSGANQAYVNCVLTLLGEGERCVVFRPYYFNHVMAIQMSRGEGCMLTGPCGDDGVPDLNWLRLELEGKGGDHIKVVTVVNPGNPTGVSLPRSYLEDIVSLCGQHGVWLVMDNTYEHFDHINANGQGTEDLEQGEPAFWCSSEEHVINIFSFSKAFSLAGFRMGYIAVSNRGARGKEMFKQMLKVQDTIAICPARISQIAALASLGAGRDWVAENVSTLDAGRNAILEALRPLEKVMGGTGAMYVMAKIPDGLDDQDFANMLVEEYGVAVIPGSFCGFPGWIRVCYSNLPPDKCLDAASRLASGIKEICAKAK